MVVVSQAANAPSLIGSCDCWIKNQHSVVSPMLAEGYFCVLEARKPNQRRGVGSLDTTTIADAIIDCGCKSISTVDLSCNRNIWPAGRNYTPVETNTPTPSSLSNTRNR